MLTDRYIKFILTAIAFGLIANLFVPFLRPVPAIAQSTGKKWTDIQSASFSLGDDRHKQLLQQGYEPFAAGPGGIYFRK